MSDIPSLPPVESASPVQPRPSAWRRPSVIIAAVALALPVAQLTRNAAAQSLRGAVAAEDYGRAILDPLPPRTVLLTSYFETTFQLVSQQVLLGARPDVAVIDRKLFHHPYAPAAVRRRFPDLAAFIDAGLEGPASGRPLRFELAPDLTGDPASFVLLDDLTLPTTCADDRHGADRVLTWTAYLTARFHCAASPRDEARKDQARAALARARALTGPGDAMLEDLERACDLR